MAHLQIIDGPGTGRRHELTADAVVMGRHPDCDLVLDVGAVSRQHAKIERAEGKFFLQDLGSRNGTLLNDLPLAEPRELAAGDRFQICDVKIEFRDDLAPGPVAARPAFAESSARTHDSAFGALLVDDTETATAQITGTLDLSIGSGTIHISASPEAKLTALLEINRHLGKRLALDEVLPEVLEGLFQIFVQADRGFIVLEDTDGNLVPRWTKLRREESDDSLRISSTIVKKVMESKQALLSADAASDAQFQMSQSIADLRIRSMMCVPLTDANDKAIGVLQIDTLDQRKKFKQEDLEVLAAVASQAGVAIDNARMHEEALARVELDKDLELAHKVQKGIVPDAAPKVPGYTFAQYYEPANQVGGDYYDYVPLSGGRVAVVVADVVGHGVAAALLMARLSSQVRFCLAGGDEPGEALAQVNKAFGEIGIDSRFVTMWLGVLDPAKNTLTVANAGHMPTMIRKGDGQVVEVGQEETGFPVGVLDDSEYEQLELEIAPGELIAMYSDGVNEAIDPSGELYEIETIAKRLGQPDATPDSFVPDVIEDVHRFMNGEPQGDDMCLVCFGRTS